MILTPFFLPNRNIIILAAIELGSIWVPIKTTYCGAINKIAYSFLYHLQSNQSYMWLVLTLSSVSNFFLTDWTVWSGENLELHLSLARLLTSRSHWDITYFQSPYLVFKQYISHPLELHLYRWIAVRSFAYLQWAL